MTWSLQQLRYFVAVAEAGGVTAAAEALNISQPAISSAIAQLEVSLGGALFLRRQGRRVTLTPMGRRALEQARSLLIQAEDFSAGMLNPDALLGGRLAVGCYHDLAPYFMPRLIRAFGAEHPETTIELQEGDFEDMGQRLARGSVELAISYRLGLGLDLGRERGLSAEILLSLPVQALLPAGHQLTGQAKVSLADLAREPLILTRVPHSGAHFLALFQDRGLEPKRGMVIESFETQRGLVANGLGVALSYTQPEGDLAYDGKPIVRRPVSDPIPEQPVVLLRNEAYPLSGRAKEFRALARALFEVDA